MPQPKLSPRRPSVMTCGLVVTLDSDSRSCDSVLAALGADSAITLGERAGHCIPVAIEAADAEESEERTEWLRRLPGVGGVEVVFVHWDDQEQVTHADS